MGWWTARAGRPRRIGLRRAERLLAGGEHAREPGLAALLSEAAGPPRPDELAGEPDAVGAFRRVRSAAPSMLGAAVSTVDIAGRRPPLWRSAGVRLAVVVLLLAAAGTVTVRFGYLPARMQPVPPVPSTAPVAGSPSPSTSGPSGPSYQPSPPTTPAPTGAAPLAARSPRPPDAPKLTAQTSTIPVQDADVAEATQLCRVWTDPDTDKATRDAAAQRLHELMAVLGGPNGMPAFCRKLLTPKKDKSG